MLQLTSNLEAAAADSRIEFVILSYGRVPLIDPSAAENIKLAQDKMVLWQFQSRKQAKASGRTCSAASSKLVFNEGQTI